QSSWRKQRKNTMDTVPVPGTPPGLAPWTKGCTVYTVYVQTGHSEPRLCRFTRPFEHCGTLQEPMAGPGRCPTDPDPQPTQSCGLSGDRPWAIHCERQAGTDLGDRFRDGSLLYHPCLVERQIELWPQGQCPYAGHPLL